MDKKTAMQTLIDELKYQFSHSDNHLQTIVNIVQKAENELFEKEKEQIIDAYDYGYYCASNGTSAEITLDGKMHYNQRYNQKQHIIDIMKADEEDGLYNQNKSNGE